MNGDQGRAEARHESRRPGGERDRVGDHVSGDMDEISLVAFTNVLLRRRWSLIVPVAVCLGVAVVLTVTMHRGEYVAESRFMLESSSDVQLRLGGLAERFGIPLSEPPGEESLTFYTELLASRELLREAATSTYRFATMPVGRDTIEGSLIEIYGIEAETAQNRIRAAMGMLRESIRTEEQLAAGMLRVETIAPWPDLAVQLNRRLLDLINEFNAERRRTRARAQREFVATQLDTARAELRGAEGKLERFLQQNRRYDDSPQLMFEVRRLQREVGLRQQIYTSLATTYEQARVEEVRNTPVITIVESPERSARPARGNLALNGVLGLILGGLFGTTLALLREHVDRQRRRHPEHFLEFQRLRRIALSDVSPRRLLKRARSGRADDRGV